MSPRVVEAFAGVGQSTADSTPGDALRRSARDVCVAHVSTLSHDVDSNTHRLPAAASFTFLRTYVYRESAEYAVSVLLKSVPERNEFWADSMRMKQRHRREKSVINPR